MLFTNSAEPTISLSSAAATGFDGDERRTEHRRRILKGAVIKFNNGFGNLECVLRNLTSAGARISMGQTAGIPSRLQIHIAGERTPIDAAVQWRTPRDIGLSFLLKSE
ncbi:MAG: PilZ domain-containing protein [Rhizobiaceae bacterium]